MTSFTRGRRFALVAAFVFCLLPVPAQANTRPGAWHKDYRNGYRIRIPDKWSRVPPGTQESVEVGKWYGRAIGYVQPELVVAKISTRKPADATPADPDAIPVPEEIRKRMRLMQTPTSGKEWLDQQMGRLPGKATIDETKDIKLDHVDAKLYLATIDTGRGLKVQIDCAVVHKDDVDFAILFTAEQEEYKRSHERAFLMCIKSFGFLEVKDENDVDYSAAFDSENLPKDEQEQQRWLAKVKESIDDVKEWDWVATKNYLLLYDKKVDVRDVKKVGVQIEAIRRDVYEKLFPPDEPIKAISVVRICKDHAQYSAYGGPGGSAGYWNPAAKELVFYFEGRDALRVLQHEAFHQYIFYAFGSVAPAIWFNEGHGDYFAGFNYRGHFVPGKFQWREDVIKNAIATNSYVPLKEFIHYDQAQYYANANLCYAEGWSFIYFLRTTRDKEYRKILPTYFDTLKKCLGDTKEEGAPDGFRDPTKEKEALKKALDTAFAGIDLDQLEKDWKEFKY